MPGHVSGWIQEIPRGRGTCEAESTPFPSRQPAESALPTLLLSAPSQRQGVLLLSSPNPKPPTESNATSAVLVEH